MPNGIILENPPIAGVPQRVTIAGQNKAYLAALAAAAVRSETPPIPPNYADTIANPIPRTPVDSVFWSTWLAANAALPMVLSGAIVQHS